MNKYIVEIKIYDHDASKPISTSTHKALSNGWTSLHEFLDKSLQQNLSDAYQAVQDEQPTAP